MAMAASLFVFPLDARRNKLPSSRSPSLTRTATNYNKQQQPKGRRRPPPITASSSSSFRNGTPPETDCPVPLDQLPVNEFQALSTSFPFSWAAADLRLYSSRLAVTGGLFALLVGLPVSAFGTHSLSDPRCALGAASAGLLAVTLAVLRMYLGWAYVGNRLLSATVECEKTRTFKVSLCLFARFDRTFSVRVTDEETGWYDGQIWVKTPEVLARDRLLGSFSVKPILSRVKLTLVGLAVSLFVCALIFVNIEYPASAPGDSGGQARAIPGAYNDESARSFEPDAFCGESDLSVIDLMNH